MRGPAPESILDNEVLARFIMYRHWIRADGTVRSDAFAPPRNLQLSTTRHLDLTESEIWEIGQMVANARDIKLLGRADIAVRSVTSIGLSAQSAPIPENPNHAHVTGWPQDKPSQKSLAQQLAAMAAYVSSV